MTQPSHFWLYSSDYIFSSSVIETKTGSQETGKGKSSVTQLSFGASVPLREGKAELISRATNASCIISLCTKSLLFFHMPLNYVRWFNHRSRNYICVVLNRNSTLSEQEADNLLLTFVKYIVSSAYTVSLVHILKGFKIWFIAVD